MFKFPPKYKVMPYYKWEGIKRFKGFTIYKRFLLFFYFQAHFDNGLWGLQIALHQDQKRIQELCDDYNSGRKK